jgi:hypothetical protein
VEEPVRTKPRSLIFPLLAVALAAGAGAAAAQPAPSGKPDQPAPAGPGPAPPAAPAPGDEAYPPAEGDAAPADGAAPSPDGAATAAPADGAPTPATAAAAPADPWPVSPPKPPPPLLFPVLIDAPTARILPAGVIMVGGGVDTGGATSTDLRIGLGDVAEFGVGTTDHIRVRTCPTCNPESITGYPVARFVMGLSEERLFRWQPALAIGFQKSFSRDHDDRTSRVAELYVVASKQLGRYTHLHLGGALWDASIEREDGSEIVLHDGKVTDMLRAFGGIEIEALPRSHILVEVSWTPELRLADAPAPDSIELRPMLSWGVRYELASWAHFESGVRVPDIGDANLLDAQIFGQLRLVTRRFAHVLNRLQGE